MTAPIRIFGIGSPFGDDRIGWLAAEALQGRFDPAQVSVSSHDRPGAGLINLMRGARLAVLVDAVQCGAPAGSLHRLEGKAIRQAVARYTSTHGFGIAEALELAERLHDAPDKVVLWGVEGATSVSIEMSLALQNALPGLLAAVMGEIDEGISTLN
jgi:hydrogenase maturation protease